MRMLKNYTLIFAGFLTLGLLVTACKDKPQTVPAEQNLVSNYDYKVVHGWNELFLEIERYAAGYRPAAAPRALAYLGFSAYESTVSGMPEYQSLANLYSGLSIPQVQDGAEYHWPTVVNASYAYLMAKFFPNASPDRFAKIATLENSNNAQYQSEVSAEVFQRSQAHGRAVAAAVWEWSKTDGGHDYYLTPFGTTYNWQDHFDGNGDWVPTVPGPNKPMYPDWGRVRTWALPDGAKICKPPVPFSENPQSAFYAQALEVYAQHIPTPSYEGEWIGEFWSDDLVNLTFSPGPRWIAIADQVFANENANLEKTIVTCAKTGMALSDAAVGCWNSKYYYNLERPSSYIQRVIDPNWKPILNNPLTGDIGFTPAFPAYPSGHSTMGGAGAEAIASEFGYSYAMTDHCHENRTEFIGTPRSFGSLYEMAQENAWSRVPLGVHFRMDSEEGVRYGTVIGRYVEDLPWKK